MRELSQQELQPVSGGKHYSDYLPEDVIPVSVSTGYTIAAFAKSLAVKNYQSSATDLAVSLSTCHKRLKTIREVAAYVYELPTNSKPFDIVSYFVCGTVMGLAGTPKRN